MKTLHLQIVKKKTVEKKKDTVLQKVPKQPHHLYYKVTKQLRTILYEIISSNRKKNPTKIS